MRCLLDEVLRAKIDNEIGETERAEAELHLASCENCRKRMDRMTHEIEEVAQAFLALELEESTDPRAALVRFQARLDSEIAKGPTRRSFLAGFFARHPISAWGGTVIAALVIILITLAPARSWAQRVLAMLRVQKIAVVPIDFNLTPGRDTQALIRQVISNDVTVTLSPGKPQFPTNASEATQMTGFPVRVITSMTSTPQIGVVGEQAYVMTLDQNRLQEILNSFGRTDLQIPSSVNGQIIAVHIPKSAFLRYGNCPTHELGANQGQGGQKNAQPSGGNCVVLAEVPSPTVSVPPDLNITQLFEIGLEAAGMSPQEAQAFCQTVDWKSTLVVPIPSRASSYVQEQVDGVEGDLIMGPSYHGRPSEFTLIWVKNGIIYSIHGSGDPQRGLALAGSLS